MSTTEAFHRARLAILKARDNNLTPFSDVPKNVIEKARDNNLTPFSNVPKNVIKKMKK